MLKRWANGQSMPHIVYAFRVEQFTKGAVPVASWLATDIGRDLWANMGLTTYKTFMKKRERAAKVQKARQQALKLQVKTHGTNQSA